MRIPAHWATATFNDLFEVVSDRGKRLEQRSYSRQGALPVIDQGSEDIGGYTDALDLEYTGPLPILVFGDHTRRVKYVDRPFVVGAQGVKLLKPHEQLLPKFAFYQLKATALLDRGYGRHFALLRSQSFVIPPLDEQRRTIEIIESQFSRLDVAEFAASRANAKATLLAGAALEEAACIAGARQPIGDLEAPGRRIAYGVLQPGVNIPGGVSLVRVGDINSGCISIGDLKTIAPELAAAYPRTVLRGGEVVLTIVGTIGRAAVVPPSLTGANVARAVAVLPLCDLVLPEFVSMVLNARSSRTVLTQAAHEVARKTLNLEDVRKFTIPVPSLSIQKRVIAEVQRRCSIIDAVARSAETAVIRAQRLRDAILRAAIRGQLELSRA